MNRAEHLRRNPKQRDVRIKEYKQEKKNQRNILLGEHRKIEKSPQPIENLNKKKSRLELLKEWKLQKQEKENNTKVGKKLPFYTGKIQRKATGSPKPTLTHSLTLTKNCVTTRLQAKKNILTKPLALSRLNKAGSCGLNPVENHLFILPKGVASLQEQFGRVLTVPMSPKITRSARKSSKPLFTDVGGEFPKPIKINFSGLHTLSSYKKQRSSIFPSIPEFSSKKKELFTENTTNVPLNSAIVTNIKNKTDLPIKEGTIPKNTKNVDSKVEMTYSPAISLKVQSNCEPLVFSPLADSKLGSQLRTSSRTKKSLFIDDEIVQEETRNSKSGDSQMEMRYSPDNLLGVQTNFEHLTFSPLIEKKRGTQKRKSSGIKKPLCIEDEIEQEETIKKSRIQSFKLFLINETHRLLTLADNWNQIAKETKDIPSDVEGDINAVVGKTKLLTSDKFKQFEGLITKCEGGDPLIKVDDLQGFHDWVSLEIEDLDKSYCALKESQAKNWANSPKKIELKKPSKVQVKPLKKKPAAISNMRALIMAARKQMQTKTSPKSCLLENEETLLNKSPSSPRHAACLSTPRDSNLRVQVLQRCSGIEIMNATLKARQSASPNKPVTPKSHNEISVINKTPGKSILRKTPAPVSEKKSVFFGLDPKYLKPAEDSPLDDSPHILQLIDNVTPLRPSKRLFDDSKEISESIENITPLRRSKRQMSKIHKL